MEEQFRPKETVGGSSPSRGTVVADEHRDLTKIKPLVEELPDRGKRRRPHPTAHRLTPILLNTSKRQVPEFHSPILPSRADIDAGGVPPKYVA